MPDDHSHPHDHAPARNCPRWRRGCGRSKPSWPRRAMSIRRRSTRSSRRSRPGSARATAPASSPAPGPTPNSSAGCSPTRPRRPIRSAMSSPVGSHLIAVENTPADPQPRRLHPVLVLSVGGAGAAAGLVQIRPLPLARGDRPEGRARRFRRDPAGRDRDPRLGFDRRDAVSSSCRCGPPAPRGGARSGSPPSSPATA